MVENRRQAILALLAILVLLTFIFVIFFLDKRFKSLRVNGSVSSAIVKAHIWSPIYMRGICITSEVVVFLGKSQKVIRFKGLIGTSPPDPLSLLRRGGNRGRGERGVN
jgi:hypothetical protein